MWGSIAKHLVLLAWVVALVPAALAEKPDATARNARCITPLPANPYYWQYGGKPVILLGGSVEDNLFQIPDLEAHLDLLVASGGNYIRNTLSSRDEGNVWMFARGDDGRYDLDRFDERYYERLQRLLDLCLARDIVVQFELWDRFDYAREQWLGNPFRPSNNINYTSENSGLREAYPNHPGTNENPFFRTVPDLDNNERILGYQQMHMNRVLELSLPYPNVLYCMDNETGADPAWGAYWAQYVKEKAAALGVVAHTTEMWDDWNLSAPQHRETLDHPERYSFVDTSQNNHKKGQEHWDNLQWVRNYLAASPRPINHVKAYGADGGRFGDSRDGVERFWRSLLGGAASIRFHRPDSGLGLSDRAQANLKSARMLCDRYDLTAGVPLSWAETTGPVLRVNDPNEAYVHRGTTSGVVYMPRGGEVRLVRPDNNPSLSVQWLNIEASTWLPKEPLADENPILSPPSDGAWLAVVTSDPA